MVFGIVGDLIDVMAIVTTVFAICTSMGIGAIQVTEICKYTQVQTRMSMVCEMI